MTKSKTKISKQLKNKNDKELVDTIIAAKKNPKWYRVAEILASPRKNHKQINLDELNKLEGKIIVVPGKVLSQGEVSKKIKIVALKFSEKAKEKLIKDGCEVDTILNEINKNKDAKEVVIL
jgi:large subunit ribosomal protein L18e